MRQKPPPFYENFDDTHCVQCVLRGMLEHFEPDSQWTWDELDALTAKEPGKWTWPYRGILNLLDRGYEVVWVTSAQLKDYLELGIYGALVKNLGEPAADKQREMADLDAVAVDLKRFWDLWQEGKVDRREHPASLKEMRELLDEGYLVSSSLNIRRLYGRLGYASHVVLVYDFDDDYVYCHDSGLPAVEARKITHEDFVAASTDPTPEQWGFTAYRKRA